MDLHMQTPLLAVITTLPTPTFAATAVYAGGNNFLYDNHNAEMITKKSAQMYCATGAPSFPVVDATIQGAHDVGPVVQCLPCLVLLALRCVCPEIERPKSQLLAPCPLFQDFHYVSLSDSKLEIYMCRR